MFSIDLIAIPQQEARCCLLGKGFNDLLCGPEGSRMGRHIEMHHLSPVMKQHNEGVQHIESHSGHGEEVNCGNLTSMIPQKVLPCLRRWLVTSDSILRDG